MNPSQAPRQPVTRKRLFLSGAAIGAAYGLFVRFAVGLKCTGAIFGVMTSSFIVGMPIALGFLTVWFGDYRGRYGFLRRVLMPWVAALGCLVGCLALMWEGILCVALWLPLTLILASFGGVLAWICEKLFRSNRSRALCAGVVALAPLLASPLETMREASIEIRRVETQIEIAGRPSVVWAEIKSVRRIAPAELPVSTTGLLGFPRPIEATLNGTGVGAYRLATFDGRVEFRETITAWEENRLLSFRIAANTSEIPPTTFDEHVTVGGPFFDVLQGTYEIEELGPNRVRLHLWSDQRLSTRFNFYSHLWTEFLMADIQRSILRVIKSRVENRANGA